MGTPACREEGRDQKARGTGRPAASGRASRALSLPCRRVCRGRFGQVHRCTEKSTGLALAAKVIKVKSTKDRVRRPPRAPAAPGPAQGSCASFSAPRGPTLPQPTRLGRRPATLPTSLLDAHTLVSRSLAPWATGPSQASGFSPVK